MNTLNPKSSFIHVNGIRLHYLDWGGVGPAMIFLAGMGSSAYIFGEFAPRFTDRFHVLALTRRGHGDSDYPETGYDPDTLVEDIRQFMDALNVQKAILAGHSLAGVELTHFAGTYPERVEKLIYLDALDDRRREKGIMEQNPLRNVVIEREPVAPPRTFEEYLANVKKEVPEFAAIWGKVWEEEFSHNVMVGEDGIFIDKMPVSIEKMLFENLVNGYAPKEVNAVIPTLFFIGNRKRTRFEGYTTEQIEAYKKFDREVREPFLWAIVDEFKSRFPHAKTIVIPNGHHYCFIAQADLVYAETKNFLLED